MTEARSESHIDASRQGRAKSLENAGQRYRFERLALPIVLRDLYFSKDDPGPGDSVPAFDLPTVGGGRFRSSDLAESGPVLLIFGSSTCPVTDNAAPGLKELHLRFGNRVRFVIVNVREAHPGKIFPQPGTLEAKMQHAEKLRGLHGFEFEVAVDDVHGTLHRALSPKPNSAYLIGADGTILFRAQWANDAKALAAALDAIVAGRLPRHSQSGGMLKPMLRILRNIAPALDRAGRGAWADMWRVAPPLAAIALVLRYFGVRPATAPTPVPQVNPAESAPDAGDRRSVKTSRPRDANPLGTGGPIPETLLCGETPKGDPRCSVDMDRGSRSLGHGGEA